MVVLLQIVLVPIDTGEQPRVLFLLLGGRGDEMAHIALHHLHELLGDWRGVVHAGTHVDLDDPRIQVLVDHEVIADHLEEALLASD